ncbi:MAG: hypothetical protein ACJ8AW_42020 [Rhodopila sp.]
MGGLLGFCRMTGDLVKAMRACPLRLGTEASKVAFLFTRVGLAGAGHGRLQHPAADRRRRACRRSAGSVAKF